VYITHGCTILTHFLDTSKIKTTFTIGKVTLEENCFLGCNSVICAPITIGKNSIVAAGSIVTKNIPPNELWGGVPAKFIKKLY
ncbi:MAG: acyltransferase, partial [Muribaculaceae bacterium]|nr:acyltransferase [Muribaculaceae bacterium]